VLLMHMQGNEILMVWFAGMVEFGNVERGRLLAAKMECMFLTEKRVLMWEKVVAFGEM